MLGSLVAMACLEAADMGVTIKVAPARHRNRRSGFNKRVIAVAPHIRDLQSAGFLTIDDIANALNAAGLKAPTGPRWSYGTTRRVMLRAAELELGVVPRTLRSSRSHGGANCSKWMGISCAEQNYAG